MDKFPTSQITGLLILANVEKTNKSQNQQINN